jgi:hypothetical protein
MGEFQRELAAMVPEVKADAIYRNEVLVDLMPGFWQARTTLAWSLVRLGEFEAGLRVVQEAKDIRVLESTGAHVTYYIQAFALRGIGSLDEARSAARCSIAYRSTNQAIDLLAELGEEVGDTLALLDVDFMICPEIEQDLRNQ